MSCELDYAGHMMSNCAASRTESGFLLTDRKKTVIQPQGTEFGKTLSDLGSGSCPSRSLGEKYIMVNTFIAALWDSEQRIQLICV